MQALHGLASSHSLSPSRPCAAQLLPLCPWLATKGVKGIIPAAPPRAQYFSMRRLAMMLAIAALLNVARLEGVRRALNRMAGQLDLPLRQEQQAAAAGGGGAPGAPPAAGAGGAGQPAAPAEAAGQGEPQRREGGEAGEAGRGAAAGGEEGAPAAGGEAGAREPGGEGEAVARAGAGEDVGQPPPQQQQPQQQQRPRPGILQEVQALVVGFLTSLLPGEREQTRAGAQKQRAARLAVLRGALDEERLGRRADGAGLCASTQLAALLR